MEDAERPAPHDDDPLLILTLTHEQAVALAAAAIHFQGWCTRHDEAMAAASTCLEEVTHTILTHPQLSQVSHATLEDMRYQLIEREDEPEGGEPHAAAP